MNSRDWTARLMTAMITAPARYCDSTDEFALLHTVGDKAAHIVTYVTGDCLRNDTNRRHAFEHIITCIEKSHNMLEPDELRREGCNLAGWVIGNTTGEPGSC